MKVKININRNCFKTGLLPALTALLLAAVGSACSKSESYSELLRDEEKAVNWYLAQKNVETDVPADSVFETGSDAPFYRMNEDGTVYMQVISTGDMNDRPEDGEKIYFRFMRQNIIQLMENGTAVWVGNADDLNNNVGSTYFFFGNTTYPATTQYGTGLQLPMKYLGFNSEVNLVVKSYAGMTDDQTSCQPYVYNIRYYKAIY